MTDGPDIAVIGHTNAGKTSLMRTLTRQRDFGEISAHPATTRHVELAELAVAGRTVLRLYDTPGFEDSSGLLAHLEQLKAARGEDWMETIEAVARDPSLHANFGQEAKALNQILASDVLLYVIDVRDPVRTKHRDELEVIGRCARPVLPVLNFLAGETREAAWREQLARVNMHAVVAFDTVVYREADELALYAKIATLSDAFAPQLEQLMAELKSARAKLRRASALIVADLAIDVAAARRRYPAEDEAQESAAADALKEAVRRREQDAVAELLRLHRFAERDYTAEALPFSHGEWQEDLFDAAVLERFALDTTKAAVTGATAGLAIDLMTGGITLGAAALAGARGRHRYRRRPPARRPPAGAHPRIRGDERGRADARPPGRARGRPSGGADGSRPRRADADPAGRPLRHGWPHRRETAADAGAPQSAMVNPDRRRCGHRLVRPQPPHAERRRGGRQGRGGPCRRPFSECQAMTARLAGHRLVTVPHRSGSPS